MARRPIALLADPMHDNPMNIPPVSIATAKAALLAQYADPVLRRRATMLWGPRGVGKSSVVRQVAAQHGVPLVDLRLTTIEPVDLRGAIYADNVQAKTVWFPPEFLPTADQTTGILFLDELTAADQRLQISAYSLILDRRVGHYRLPDGWMVVAAGNASFHGAVSHDMGTALADRMFHFNVQTTIEAFLSYALAQGFAPDALMIFAIFATSARTYFANSSGVPACASIPCLKSCSFTSGFDRAFTTSALSLTMISLGTLAGACTPYQVSNS